MSLTNEQYDTIMRIYSRRQADNRFRQKERQQAVYDAIPAFADLETEISSLQASRARLMLDDQAGQARCCADRLHTLCEQRNHLLAEHGFPADYLKPHYICPDCQDTGYIGRQKCHCFRQAEIDLLYHQSNLRQVLERENFSHFREDYYPEDMIDPGTGLSSRRLAQTALAEAHRFIEDFSQTHPNLFLYGSTGTGKTFLTNCIAKELLERSFSVLYFSSGQLFDRFSRHSFSSEKEDDDFRYHVFDCDLLIIDDLGTEMVNAFVSSQLFLLIKERLMRRKSTVISTNLTPENFLNTYSERIFSRISSSYQILKLFGDDIRLRKKLLEHTVS